MFLFIVLLIAGAALSIAGSLMFLGSTLESIFFLIVSLVVTFTIALHISLSLTVLLGRKVQWVLQKSDVLPIVYFDEKIFETADDTFYWTDATDTFFDAEADEPYLIINRYNIPNWARLLIFEIEDDRIEYIVYRPIDTAQDS